MIQKKVAGEIIFALVFALMTGCSRPAAYTSVDGVMLGTTLHISGDVEKVSAQQLYAAAMQLDSEAKASMSIFDSTSLLSRVNRNLTDSVDRHIAFNFHLADSISRISGGAYDVTVKPLVDAWGFAAKQAEKHPNLDSILQFVGHDKVRIEGGRIFKSDPRVQLDFNSIAKGYTVDLLAELVKSYGAQNYIVDIGGEVVCHGVNPEGEPWRIGIETPFDGNMSNGEYLQKRVQMRSGALATSGNYRRFHLDEQGNKIAHTLDPHTGRSVVSRLLSVTVVAPTCAEADAMATMYMALGADKALQKAESDPTAKVYFILAGKNNTYEEYISPAMKSLIMK